MKLESSLARLEWRGLLLVGLAAVAVANLVQWRRDRALACRLRAGACDLPAASRWPSVSALVAAWNEEDRIEAHVESFLSMCYPSVELVLCAGGDDRTLDLARNYEGGRIRVIEQKQGEGKQHALARCLDHASGEVIYLTDADCHFSGEALTRLLRPLLPVGEDGGEGEQVATGGSRPLIEQERRVLPLHVWAADAYASARSPDHVGGLLGRNAAVKREALDRIGGLAFEARTGTDYQLARRLIEAGYRIRYVRESVVRSEYPEDVGEYRRRQSRWLRNLVQYQRRHPSRGDLLSTTRTLIVGIAMVATPLFALLFARPLLVPWLCLLAHAVFSKLRYAAFAARLDDRPVSSRLLVCLPALTLIDFVVWALAAVDLLSSRRRARW